VCFAGTGLNTPRTMLLSLESFMVRLKQGRELKSVQSRNQNHGGVGRARNHVR
jgi:hypothetical protein